MFTKLCNTGLMFIFFSQVEVDGVWGFVCDDRFGFEEADLVCRELGYDSAELYTSNNNFGNKTLGLWCVNVLGSLMSYMTDNVYSRQ